jgi:hypothetical protein
MRTLSRRYVREFGSAMIAYGLLLPLAAWALHNVDLLWARATLALLPVVAMAAAARAILRFVRDSDELQRRIHLESLALAALVLCVGCFALGMLARAGVLAFQGHMALIVVLPAYVLLYGAFAAVASHRYR